MKKAISLLHYQWFTLMKSPKYVMPLILLLVLQLSIYLAIQARPVDLLDAIFLGEFYVFIIGIWLGFSANGWNDEITEQLLVLRMKSKVKYDSLYVVFLFIICLWISLICVLIPLAMGMIHRGFFAQSVLGSNLLYSFLLFLGSSFSGIALGALFHPRLCKDKSSAILYVLLAGVFSIARVAIVSDFEWLKYLLWVFPNIASHSEQLSGNLNFSGSAVAQVVTISLLYGALYSAIKVFMLNKRKY